jgi:hypothetical protein
MVLAASAMRFLTGMSSSDRARRSELRLLLILNSFRERSYKYSIFYANFANIVCWPEQSQLVWNDPLFLDRAVLDQSGGTGSKFDYKLG